MSAHPASSLTTLSEADTSQYNIRDGNGESTVHDYRDMRILQANMRKSREGQEALFNDARLRSFGAIAVQEPHCFTSQEGKPIVTPVTSSIWIQHLPTKISPSRWPVRSCLWTHKDIRTTQIPIPSHDLTAVLLHLPTITVMLASVYIPPTGTAEWGPPSRIQDNNHLRHRLRLLQEAINTARGSYTQVEVLLLGDFNRHDHLWGGDRVATTTRQGEAELLTDFIEEEDLTSLLPRGTVTFENYSVESTIDIALATRVLAESRICCKCWDGEYGSDHRAIESSFKFQFEELRQGPRLLLKSAPWTRIREEISRTLTQNPRQQDMDSQAEQIVSAVKHAVEKYCPRAKPSKYAKRWWTTDLTKLRKEYTTKRNAARTVRRTGVINSLLEADVKQCRREFHHTLRKQKKHHWIEFLAEPTNIWKAARYLEPDGSASFARVPALNSESGLVTCNEGIAKELLHSFFPPPTIIPEVVSPGATEQLQLELLTIEDVRKAVFNANPNKAPGRDGLPMLVWRMLWPCIKDELLSLFCKSLGEGRLPREWKIAKIIPLRKGNKPDYSIPNAYRPISLLSTLGKMMESIVADRISYLVETCGLLPKNHFGGRKQRSTTHALLLLQEKIYDAWRAKKTLSLISFDNKGAYNGVAKEPELQRLRARGVPEPLVRWIDDFCSDRKACVSVNGYTSPVYDLPQAGLPQGSPLSPILFLFFNADIVQKAINGAGGSIAFVDDYSAWIVGSSAEENTRLIQERIVSEAQQWELESGATFDPAKTQFIHFSRTSVGERTSSTPISFKNQLIHPSASVKILGVIMDSGLRYQEHIARAAKRGLYAAKELRRLKGLQPKTTRQLFTTTVAPVMDYASAVWFPLLSEKRLQLLFPAQRLASQAVTCSFKSVSLVVAEAEASILPIRRRLYDQAKKLWIDLHTLPNNHPIRRVGTKLRKRFTSPLQTLAKWFEPIDLRQLEQIEPYCITPWQPKPTVVLHDRKQAESYAAQVHAHILPVFVHSTAKGDTIGLGIKSTDPALSASISLGGRAVSTSHSAALQSIKEALHRALPIATADGYKSIEVFSCCYSALQSLHKPGQQSGQDILRQTFSFISRIQSTGVSVIIRWISFDAKIPAYHEARRLAKVASRRTTTCTSNTVLLKTAAKRQARELSLKPPRDAFATSTTGKFIKQLDRALPGPHTKQLYNGISSEQASILIQLRTSNCKLNSYLVKIGASETSGCLCGAENETVQHFLFSCPRWKIERRDILRNITTTRWGDKSFFLGGWSGPRLDGELSKWSPNIEAVKAAIKFAKATKRLSFQDEALHFQNPITSPVAEINQAGSN